MTTTSIASVAASHNPISFAQPIGANNYAKYLGPPAGNVTPSAYDKVAYTNYDLPEYYKGKNLYLRDIIKGFILEDNEWYTTVCLPWAYTPQLYIEWDTWEFNTVLAGRVPHEGISRLITSSKKKSKAHVVRKGLAFVMEADFFNTPEGDLQYERNVKGISQCVQETQNHDTIFSLLDSKNNERLWQDKFGKLPFSYQTLLDHEIADYANICSDQEKLDIILEQWKKVMSNNRVIPDMLILPQGTQLYLAMAQPKQTEYWGIGPDGAYIFKKGPDALAEIRGLKVFETRNYEVTKDGTIDLMTRAVQIGERYEMCFRDWRNNDLTNYTSKWRDIYIYNENTDAMEKITFLKAYQHSNMFLNGEVHPLIKEMIDDLNGNKTAKKKRRFDSHLLTSASSTGDYNTDASPHFMITKDNEGMWTEVKYFGQLDTHNATSQDFIQVGQSIVGKLFGDKGKHMTVWNDMIKLIEQIEGQKYDREYWRRLIELNLPYSLDDKGRFVGELTPEDVANNWHLLTQLHEWTPNGHGTLNLPKRPKGVTYPAGFANAPGFQALANEINNPDTTWGHIAKRASEAVEFVNLLISVLKTICPESEAIKLENRSPWFHRPDAFTTFFDTVIAIPRDPIWIAALPPVRNTTSMEVEGETRGGSDSDVIPWKVRPLLVFTPNYENLFDKELIDAIAALGQGNAGGEDNAYLYVRGDGTMIEMEKKYFKKGAMVSREILALKFMGQNSAYAYFALLKKLSENQEGYNDAKIKLIEFIIGAGMIPNNVETLRQIVRGLADLIPNPENLIKCINAINLTETSTAKQKEQARKLTRQLANNYKNVSDPDIPEFATSILGEPTEIDSDDPSTTAGYSQVSKAMDQIFEIVSQLKRYRKNPIEKFQLKSKINGGDNQWFTAPDGLDNKQTEDYNNLAAELKILVDQVESIVQQYTSEGTEDQSAQRGKSWVEDQVELHYSDKNKEISVQDDSKVVMSARFFRSPLTMSLALLESLANEKLPLIRPSDPRTHHTTFYDPTDTGEEPGYIPKDIYSRPQYAHIDKLIGKPDLKELMHTNFIMKHIGVEMQEDESLPKKKHKRREYLSSDPRRGSLFDDPNSEEESDHADSDFEQQEWTLKELKRKGTRGEKTKRIPFTMYSDLYNKVLTGTFIHRYKEANKIANPLLRASVITVLMTPFTDELIHRFIDNNIHVLFNLLLWRLFIEHDMSSAIILKSGLETGANLYGHSNFVTGSDVTTKVFYGNFTFNSKAVVWNDKNVNIIPNIRPQGYRGGNNTRFITSAKEIEATGIDRPSIIVTAIPITEDSFQKDMSFTGYHFIHDINESIDGKQKLHYSTAPFYDRLYGVSKRSDTSNILESSYFDESDRVNNVALQGLQFNYNTSTGLYDKRIACRGHRKENGSGTGAAAVWKGQTKYFPKQDWSQYRLE